MILNVELVDETVRVGTVHGRGVDGVLVIPGRGDSLELRRPVVERLARRAGTVALVELRGQGGSGRDGAHPDAVHIDDFEQHLADITTVTDQLPDRLHLVAHSMGGLLAAHLLGRHPDRFVSAAISSPMWRFRQPLAVVRATAGTACALGGGGRFAAGERPFNAEACIAMRTGRPSSTDGVIESFIDAHPELLRGGSTWGWVSAAARSMAALDAAPLEKYTGVVAVGSCRDDQTVSLAAHHRVARRFPHGRVVELDGAHDPYLTEASVRWWSTIDALLDGGDPWNC
jgi:lysophospholipase